MIVWLLFFALATSRGEFSEEYVDPEQESVLVGEVVESETGEPVLITGFWKCGNCSEIDDSRLVYTEDNDYGDEDKNSVDIEINLTLPNMRCVTVATDKPGVVKKLTGACDGPSVTLSVYPAGHFTIQVYN